MIDFTAWMFVLLGLLIAGLMLLDAARGRVYLISFRNVFLLGFIIFQVTSSFVALSTRLTWQFPLSDMQGTGLKMLLWCAVFFGAFYLAYPRLPLARMIIRKIPVTRFQPRFGMTIALSLLLTVIAVVLHFGVMIPLVAVLASYLAVSFASIACGLIGWAWAPRLWNPLMLVLATAVVSINTLTVITGSFGRRSMLAVLACLLWGMFYGWWRHYSPVRAVIVMGLIGIVPLILLSLYTSARSSREHDRTAVQHLQAMARSGSVSKGLMLMMTGQDAGAVSMWCMENHPSPHHMRPAFTMRYVFMYPVPRALWPSKPPPLSMNLPHLARMEGVDRDRLTIGPGIIGHTAAEGGFIMVFVYAVILAYVCRVFDGIVLKSIDNPIVVLPIGSALGQTLGLSRGETGAFMFIMLFSIVGSYAILIFSAKFLELVGVSNEGESLAGAEADYDLPDPFGEWSQHAHHPDGTPDARDA